jgi:hypothetical protein
MNQIDRLLALIPENDAFAALFAPDAVVHDEGGEHRGLAAIKTWIAEAHRKIPSGF